MFRLSAYPIFAGALCMIFLGAGCSKKVEEAAQEKLIEGAMNQALKAEGRDADVNVSVDEGTVSYQVKEDDKEVNVSVNEDSGNVSMQMTGPDGAVTTTTMGTQTKVPENFPKDVPVYPGLELTMAHADAAAGPFAIQGLTADTMEKVASHYTDTMAKQGWTETTNMKQPEMTMAAYEKEGRTTSLMLTTQDGKTAVTLAVE